MMIKIQNDDDLILMMICLSEVIVILRCSDLFTLQSSPLIEGFHLDLVASKKCKLKR